MKRERRGKEGMGREVEVKGERKGKRRTLIQRNITKGATKER